MATFEIVKRPYGRECIFHYRGEAGDINGSFIVGDGDDIEAMIADQVRLSMASESVITVLASPAERPSILTWEEQAKEDFKREIISAMRAGTPMDDYIGGLTWDRAALATLLIYRYAINARDQLGAALPDESQSACWGLLATLANSMSDDQIAEVL